MNWEEVVNDPDERKVFQALGGPCSTWRTISGLARQTELSQERIASILDKYDMRLTCQSKVPSASGSPLVGLLEKVGAF